MRDITLSELELSNTQAGIESEDTLHMDQDSFASFYERTSRPVWAYLWRRTGDRHLADDLLQEAYYRFLRARVSHESETHRRNYLFRIATNLANDIHRNRVNLSPITNVEHIEKGCFSGGIPPQASSPHREDLSRAMAQLSSRQRDALWLAYAEGSSHREIAETLGLRVGSVKLILFRARRKLCKLLRSTKSRELGVKL